MVRIWNLKIALVFTLSFPLAAQDVTAVYDFVWKGFLVGSSNARISLDRHSYTLDMGFRTRGIMKLFVRGKSTVSATGHLTDAEAVIPSEFRSYGKWSGDRFSRTVYYDEAGLFQSMDLDWPQDWIEEFSNEAVPPDMQAGLDPLSVLLPVMRLPLPVTDVETPRLHRVFDGRAAYDLQLACVGNADPLKKVKRSPRHGAATQCRVGYKIVAGFPIETEAQKKKRLKREKKARKRAERLARLGKQEKEGEKQENGIKVWFQQDDRLPALNIPVRAHLMSDWGTVRMYLRDLKVSPPTAPLKSR